jgi:predicted RNA-binding protein with PIN domain
LPIREEAGFAAPLIEVRQPTIVVSTSDYAEQLAIVRGAGKADKKSAVRPERSPDDFKLAIRRTTIRFNSRLSDQPERRIQQALGKSLFNKGSRAKAIEQKTA